MNSLVFGFASHSLYLSLASLILPIGLFAVIFYQKSKCGSESCINWKYALIISLFFGFLFTFKKKNGLKISIYEKIIIVLMGYLLLPLFIATPYSNRLIRSGKIRTPSMGSA